MSKLSERYTFIEESGGAFQGKAEYLKHLDGKDITARQAIKAKCYDCMCYFSDGKQDCKLKTCPLYPFMPYREGGVRKSRVVSEEQKKASAERLKNARICRNSTQQASISDTKIKKVGRQASSQKRDEKWKKQ